jgi:hypothetical protein
LARSLNLAAMATVSTSVLAKQDRVEQRFENSFTQQSSQKAGIDFGCRLSLHLDYYKTF